ncbi:MAG: MarR family transcriptional regulator [Gallionella sp.]|nr:MarR family transcriptional regulator [Gallionella sp.]
MTSDNLGFLVGDVTRLLRRTIRQRMAGIELTFEQMRALMSISRHEGIRQVDLADLLDVQPITLVHQIDQLAENGLVERRADPGDRRAYQLFLTKAAAPHVSAARKVAAAIQADMLRGLSKEQISLVSSSLHAMRDNLASRK